MYKVASIEGKVTFAILLKDDAGILEDYSFELSMPLNEYQENPAIIDQKIEDKIREISPVDDFDHAIFNLKQACENPDRDFKAIVIFIDDVLAFGPEHGAEVLEILRANGVTS